MRLYLLFAALVYTLACTSASAMPYISCGSSGSGNSVQFIAGKTTMFAEIQHIEFGNFTFTITVRSAQSPAGCDTDFMMVFEAKDPDGFKPQYFLSTKQAMPYSLSHVVNDVNTDTFFWEFATTSKPCTGGPYTINFDYSVSC